MVILLLQVFFQMMEEQARRVARGILDAYQSS